MRFWSGGVINGSGGEIEARASAIDRAATPRAMPKQQGDAASLLRPKAKLSPSSVSSFSSALF